MVKTPRTRHSKTEREPVTIDLEPEKIERSETDPVRAEQNPAEAVSSPESRVKAEQESQTAKADEAASKASDASSANGFGRDAKSATAPAAVSQKRGGAFAGGVAGGVIALLVAGGLYYGGVLPAGNGTAQDNGATIAALETQIAELHQQIAAVDSTPQQNPEITERLAQVEARINDLAGTIAHVQEAVTSLENRPAGSAGELVDLAPVDARLSELESALAALQAQSVPQPDLTKFESDIAGLREELSVSQKARTDLAARLSQLESEISTLSNRVEEQAEGPATAIIIAASALKAAIDRGASFSAELDTFAALAPNAPELEALRAFATAGVATRVQLASESDAAANAMIAAARPVETDAGVVDRLWASAMGLVQVRPVGMVEGDGVPETVARLDAAVNAGDFARAIAEFDSLPEVAKVAGSPFMERVKARYEADRLIDEALASALKA